MTRRLRVAWRLSLRRAHRHDLWSPNGWRLVRRGINRRYHRGNDWGWPLDLTASEIVFQSVVREATAEEHQPRFNPEHLKDAIHAGRDMLRTLGMRFRRRGDGLRFPACLSSRPRP